MSVARVGGAMLLSATISTLIARAINTHNAIIDGYQDRGDDWWMTPPTLILTPEQHTDLRELLASIATCAHQNGAIEVHALAIDALDLLDDAVATALLLAMPDPDNAVRH